MGKTIRDDKGQYAGSIGDGKTNVPTPQYTSALNSDVSDSVKATWGERRRAIRGRLEELGWEVHTEYSPSAREDVMRWEPREDQIRPNSIVKVVDVPMNENNPRYEELLFAAESDTASALVYMAYTERVSTPAPLSDVRPHIPRPTRNEAGLTIVPKGAHAGDELSTLRNKLSGLHFAKEQLSTGEHEILLLAEGLLAILDEEDPRGYRR